MYIRAEPVEALRKGIFTSGKTTFVVNQSTIPGIMIAAGLEKYPSLVTISKSASQYYNAWFCYFNLKNVFYRN